MKVWPVLLLILSLPIAAQVKKDLSHEYIEPDTFQYLFDLYDELRKVATLQLIDWQKCNFEDEKDSKVLNGPPKLEQSQMVNMYLVRDNRDESVVLAMGKINLKEFEKLAFSYHNGSTKDIGIHHGKLKIGEFMESYGRLEINGKQIELKASNDVTVLTLYDGEKLRLTNFQGVSFDTSMNISDVKTGELKVLGHSGLAFDFGREHTESNTKLKLDIGLGADNIKGDLRPAVESIVKLELNFQ